MEYLFVVRMDNKNTKKQPNSVAFFILDIIFFLKVDLKSFNCRESHEKLIAIPVFYDTFTRSHTF